MERLKVRLWGYYCFVKHMLLVFLFWRHWTSLVRLFNKLRMSPVIELKKTVEQGEGSSCCPVFLDVKTNLTMSQMVCKKEETDWDKECVRDENADNSALRGNKGLLRSATGRDRKRQSVCVWAGGRGSSESFWCFHWSSAVRSFPWLFN